MKKMDYSSNNNNNYSSVKNNNNHHNDSTTLNTYYSSGSDFTVSSSFDGDSDDDDDGDDHDYDHDYDHDHDHLHRDSNNYTSNNYSSTLVCSTTTTTTNGGGGGGGGDDNDNGRSRSRSSRSITTVNVNNVIGLGKRKRRLRHRRHDNHNEDHEDDVEEDDGDHHEDATKHGSSSGRRVRHRGLRGRGGRGDHPRRNRNDESHYVAFLLSQFKKNTIVCLRPPKKTKTKKTKKKNLSKYINPQIVFLLLAGIGWTILQLDFLVIPSSNTNNNTPPPLSSSLVSAGNVNENENENDVRARYLRYHTATAATTTPTAALDQAEAASSFESNDDRNDNDDDGISIKSEATSSSILTERQKQELEDKRHNQAFLLRRQRLQNEINTTLFSVDDFVRISSLLSMSLDGGGDINNSTTTTTTTTTTRTTTRSIFIMDENEEAILNDRRLGRRRRRGGCCSPTALFLHGGDGGGGGPFSYLDGNNGDDDGNVDDGDVDDDDGDVDAEEDIGDGINDYDDDDDDTTILPYSSSPTSSSSSTTTTSLSLDDQKLLQDFKFINNNDRRRRYYKVIPIILLDALLPGQQLFFTTSDPKFETMLQYLSQSEKDFENTRRAETERIQFVSEVGVIGFNPLSSIPSDPIQVGVTSILSSKRSSMPPFHNKGGGGVQWGINANNERVIATSFKGRQMFKLVGNPWLDPTGSFWLAHVEMIDRRFEILPQQYEAETQRLFVELPGLIEQWLTLVIDADLATPSKLQKQIQRSQIDVDVLDTSIGFEQKGLTNAETSTYSMIQSSSYDVSQSTRSSCTGTNPRTRHIIMINNNSNGSGSIMIPTTQRGRALWVVAALLNPIQGCYKKSRSLGMIGQRTVCPQDLRPAMLMCQNDFDRLLLASTALRRSIDSIRRYKLEEQQR